MQTSILIDLNIIIDVFLRRSQYEASLAVLKLRENKGYDLLVSAHMITTMAYLMEHAKVPRTKQLDYLNWTLETFRVIATDVRLLKAASIKSQVQDYEDAVVERAAIQGGAEAIITRNTRDFKDSQVRAFTPEVYLAR